MAWRLTPDTFRFTISIEKRLFMAHWNNVPLIHGPLDEVALSLYVLERSVQSSVVERIQSAKCSSEQFRIKTETYWPRRMPDLGYAESQFDRVILFPKLARFQKHDYWNVFSIVLYLYREDFGSFLVESLRGFRSILLIISEIKTDF